MVQFTCSPHEDNSEDISSAMNGVDQAIVGAREMSIIDDNLKTNMSKSMCCRVPFVQRKDDGQYREMDRQKNRSPIGYDEEETESTVRASIPSDGSSKSSQSASSQSSSSPPRSDSPMSDGDYNKEPPQPHHHRQRPYHPSNTGSNHSKVDQQTSTFGPNRWNNHSDQYRLHNGHEDQRPKSYQLGYNRNEADRGTYRNDHKSNGYGKWSTNDRFKNPNDDHRFDHGHSNNDLDYPGNLDSDDRLDSVFELNGQVKVTLKNGGGNVGGGGYKHGANFDGHRYGRTASPLDHRHSNHHHYYDEEDDNDFYHDDVQRLLIDLRPINEVSLKIKCPNPVISNLGQTQRYNGTPWTLNKNKSYLQCHDIYEGLSAELEDFYEYIKPSQNEYTLRKSVFRTIRASIRKLNSLFNIESVFIAMGFGFLFWISSLLFPDHVLRVV